MIDPLDKLEADLARWQASPVSEPLQQRIHASLQRQRPSRWRTLVWMSGAAAVIWFTYLLLPPVGPAMTVVTTAEMRASKPSPDTPSILNYSQAYAESNEALDALMNRHARQQTLSSKSSESLHMTTRTLAD